MNQSCANATEVTRVRRKLTDAHDSQIARVVAMVDALPSRGVADKLIAPLRPRLAQLRPDRPLQFERLLFLPLDLLIVAPQDWSPGSPTVPRTLLAPVGEVVRVVLGDLAREIEAEILGRTTADRTIVDRVGARLWPAAAQVIAAADDTPGAWSKYGISRALQRTVTRPMAAVLEQATAIQALVVSAERGEPVGGPALLTILDRGARHGADAWGMMLALMLCRLPRADEALRVIAIKGISAATRVAAEEAIDAVLNGIEREGGEGGTLDTAALSDAGAELTRIVGLLDGLDAEGSGIAVLTGNDRGERHSRIAGIRRRLDATCRSRFQAGLAGELIAPMLSLPPDAGSAEILKLEGTARELRRLEMCGRRLGSQDSYSRMLQATAVEIRAIRGNGALTLADRVRMVEILAGPDEALAMLVAGG